MKNKKDTVLILGTDERSTLTVIRSLGRSGIAVHLGCDKKQSVCKYSYYTNKVIDFPDARVDQNNWLKKLEDVLSKTDYDLVIPTADDYLVLIVKNRNLFEKYSKLAVPDEKGFIYTYNKTKTFELAKQLDIPCPETRTVTNIKDIEIIRNEFDFPLILKPASSKIWIDDVTYSLKVETAVSTEELKSKLKRMLKYSPVLIQSFHKGIGVGLELLLNQGRIIAAFQHERVHEPLKGGGSSYRKSVNISPDLLTYSSRILKELNWSGVAMVEFKVNKENNKVVLMEINGRFWGSLPLAVNSGVNFPLYLFNMIVYNKIPEKINYKKNTYCRNITRDLDWFRENLSVDKQNPMLITVPLKKAFKDYINFLTLQDYFDTFSIDDPKPGLYDLFNYILNKIKSIRDKLEKKIYKINRSLNIFTILRNKKRIKTLLKKKPAILFICKGNICRSPFAELYLKKILGQNQTDKLKVKSTGLIKRSNRKSPESAIKASEYYGINLKAHRSNVITEQWVKETSVIFVMDIDLLLQIKFLYPYSAKKTFLLGEFLKGYPKKIEISDPYGKDISAFIKTYKKIINAIDQNVTQWID